MANQFQLLEATVDEIHDAMSAGEITSKELVERYLERIDHMIGMVPN
jgi:Asp-tRNA(Asn)/Glu-tRNA(Gln) amidotransferase A subunit family amidase